MPKTFLTLADFTAGNVDAKEVQAMKRVTRRVAIEERETYLSGFDVLEDHEFKASHRPDRNYDETFDDAPIAKYFDKVS